MQDFDNITVDTYLLYDFNFLFEVTAWNLDETFTWIESDVFIDIENELLGL